MNNYNYISNITINTNTKVMISITMINIKGITSIIEIRNKGIVMTNNKVINNKVIKINK